MRDPLKTRGLATNELPATGAGAGVPDISGEEVQEGVLVSSVSRGTNSTLMTSDDPDGRGEGDSWCRCVGLVSRCAARRSARRVRSEGSSEVLGANVKKEKGKRLLHLKLNRLQSDVQQNFLLLLLQRQWVKWGSLELTRRRS